MAGKQVDDARAAVAAASQRLAAAGLVPGTAGNVSVRTGDRVAVSPTGVRLGDLTAEQVALVDLDGRQVGGPLAPTSELGLHLGVLRERTDSGTGGDGAVVHTHAPFTTALACVLDELPIIHYALLPLGGPVRVAPYATFGTPELADAVRAALEGRSAALMASHGAVTVGHDADAAVELALLLEWGCTLYWRAAQVGEPRALGAEERQAVIDQATALAYGAPHAAGDAEAGA